MSEIRGVIAVIVAADSPFGRLADTIDDLSSHLPSLQEPQACPLCFTQPWPCTRFHDAAQRVHAGGLRLDELVPLDLHPRLWPQLPASPKSAQPAPHPAQHPDLWFDEEHRDG